MLKNNKGFTLIELILAMSLTMIVLVAVFSVMAFGTNIHRKTTVELDVQANIRKVSDKINKTTRYATSTHTIPLSSFQAVPEIRDTDWSYIGVNAAGDVVLDEPGVASGDPRIIHVLAPAQDGVTYMIEFTRVEESPGIESNSMVAVTIVGYRDGQEIISIETGIEVLNSNQIDHHSSDSDPAVALAFSMVTVGSAEFTTVTPDAYISLVLDLSGSMMWPMGGEYSTGESRYKILKDRAKAMITDFSQMGFDVYISVVVFGTNANQVWDFRNVNIHNLTNEYSNLIAMVDGLSPYTGNSASTNTGDGIRRAYYMLKSKSDQLTSAGKDSSDFTRHMMVLVDGGTQAMSYYRIDDSNWDFYTGDEAVGVIDSIPGVGNREVKDYIDYALYYCDDYVDEVGEQLVTQFKYDGEQAIKTFVIGFSAKTTDHVSLNGIGIAIDAQEFTQPDNTIKRFVIATNESDLDVAFGAFTEEVATSLWSIYGPQLR